MVNIGPTESLLDRALSIGINWSRSTLQQIGFFPLLNTYNKRETGGVGAEGKPHAGKGSKLVASPQDRGGRPAPASGRMLAPDARATRMIGLTLRNYDSRPMPTVRLTLWKRTKASNSVKETVTTSNPVTTQDLKPIIAHLQAKINVRDALKLATRVPAIARPGGPPRSSTSLEQLLVDSKRRCRHAQATTEAAIFMYDLGMIAFKHIGDCVCSLRVDGLSGLRPFAVTLHNVDGMGMAVRRLQMTERGLVTALATGSTHFVAAALPCGGTDLSWDPDVRPPLSAPPPTPDISELAMTHAPPPHPGREALGVGGGTGGYGSVDACVQQRINDLIPIRPWGASSKPILPESGGEKRLVATAAATAPQSAPSRPPSFDHLAHLGVGGPLGAGVHQGPVCAFDGGASQPSSTTAPETAEPSIARDHSIASGPRQGRPNQQVAEPLPVRSIPPPAGDRQVAESAATEPARLPPMSPEASMPPAIAQDSPIMCLQMLESLAGGNHTGNESSERAFDDLELWIAEHDVDYATLGL